MARPGGAAGDWNLGLTRGEWRGDMCLAAGADEGGYYVSQRSDRAGRGAGLVRPARESCWRGPEGNVERYGSGAIPVRSRALAPVLASAHGRGYHGPDAAETRCDAVASRTYAVAHDCHGGIT